MRQTHNYTSSQYVNDSGFPLAWMCRCCFTQDFDKSMKEEVEAYGERTKTRPGVVIGRPAGREAYRGASAMRFEQQSRERTERTEDEVNAIQLETVKPK